MFRLDNVKYKNILDIEKLNIPNNKITCIVGESGSGKTTLLKMLNKLVSCDEGSIFYDNTCINDINSVNLRREVVMLPQNPTIFPGSIKDNLLIGLKFSEKPPEKDSKLIQILNMISLNKSLDEDADKLSGGEKQRLALGRILLMDSNVFLLDEPSSALDDETEQIIIKNLVNHTKTYNKTLIMVTHSKKIANQFAQNIIEINKGKIVTKGGCDNG